MWSHTNFKCLPLFASSVQKRRYKRCWSATQLSFLPLLVFLSRDAGSWSTEGCLVNFVNSTHTVCHCYHLTSFSVLMQYTPDSHRIKVNHSFKVIKLNKPKVITLAKDVHNGLKLNKTKNGEPITCNSKYIYVVSARRERV